MSLRVLITRSTEDCRGLQRLVEDDDISIEAYPVLEFEAVESVDAWDSLSEALRLVPAPREKWLIFASPRAPRPLKEQIPRFGGQELLKFEVAAVGRTTAEAAQEHGFRLTLTGDGTGVGLGTSLSTRLVEPAFVVFACGEDYRKELPEMLRGGGHQLIILPVYQMRRLPASPLPLPAEDVDVVVLTSPRSARYYMENLREARPRCLHVALGPTTAGACRRLGIECRIPERPEMDSLAEMLRQI